MRSPLRSSLVALYLLLACYLLTWVPWVVQYPTGALERVGYGYVWAGPHRDLPTPPPGFEIEKPQYPHDRFARPDYGVVAMRLLSVTTLFGALFVISLAPIGHFAKRGAVPFFGSQPSVQNPKS